MKPISQQEFENFLGINKISIAPNEEKIGRQLSSEWHNKRTIVIHLLDSDTDDYIFQVLQVLFNLEREWLVFPRYGSLEKIIKTPLLTNVCAVAVLSDELRELINVLISMKIERTIIDSDPYILAGSGDIIAAWDHHVFSDGFTISFSNVEKSTLFISALNQVGTEFDVVYSDT